MIGSVQLHVKDKLNGIEFYDVVAHCQQMPDSSSEETEFPAYPLTKISISTNNICSAASKYEVKCDMPDEKDSSDEFLTDEQGDLEQEFLDMIARSKTKQFFPL